MLSQLETIGERYDLKPLVRQFVESLRRVHGCARELLAARPAAADAAVQSTIARYRAELGDEESTIGLAAFEYGDDEAAPLQQFDVAASGIERRVAHIRKELRAPAHRTVRDHKRGDPASGLKPTFAGTSGP